LLKVCTFVVQTVQHSTMNTIGIYRLACIVSVINSKGCKYGKEVVEKKNRNEYSPTLVAQFILNLSSPKSPLKCILRFKAYLN